MKRFQMMIDEELDAELERRSAIEGRSKAAIVREAVRTHVDAASEDRGWTKPRLEDDPLWRWMMAEPDIEPAAVDDVVYPR